MEETVVMIEDPNVKRNKVLSKHQLHFLIQDVYPMISVQITIRKIEHKSETIIVLELMDIEKIQRKLRRKCSARETT
jgi:hypothetical protein